MNKRVRASKSRPTVEDARAAGCAFMLRPADEGAREVWLQGAYAWVDAKLPMAQKGESDEAFAELTESMYAAFMDGVQDAVAAMRDGKDAAGGQAAPNIRDELELTREVFLRTQALFHALHHLMASNDEPDFDHKLLAEIGIEMMGLHWKRTAELCESIDSLSKSV